MKITDVKSLPVWAGRRNLLIFCQMMPPHTLDFLEESIRDETPGAYETLRTMTDVPLAIGEEFSSKWAFVPYVERGLTDLCRVDICNVGGLTEASRGRWPAGARPTT